MYHVPVHCTYTDYTCSTHHRALLEAQEIFGLDFDDLNEFAHVAEEGLASDVEEEEEDEVRGQSTYLHVACFISWFSYIVC